MSVVREWDLVDAPPEEVWRVVSDPRNLPRWNRYIRGVHGVPDDGLREGTRYWTEMSVMGVSFRVTAEVEEIDAPRFARIRLSGPIDATVRTWIRPAGRGRSRLEHEVEYRLRGGPIGNVIARGLQLIGVPTVLKRGVRAQKRQVERG
ncbi:MAG TPA: SRPBCC family protein [Actinomycetota bacterium]|nr:SRPBCC family protein [Actinomycetota bacterium]